MSNLYRAAQFLILASLFGACASQPKLHPEAMRHNSAGTELLAQGLLDDAEARFHLALEYNPGFPEPRSNLGIVYIKRGNLAKAEEHLRSAIELNEDYSEAWSNLGVVLEKQGKDLEAKEAYENALAIDPGLTVTRRNLAVVLARIEYFGSARAHLMRLVQIAPEDVINQSLLSYVELRLDRPNAAKERAEAVLLELPEDPVARVVRGIIHAHAGKVDRAITDLEYGVGDPTVGDAAETRLAALYATQGKTAQAWVIVNRRLEKNENDAAMHFVAGYLSLEAGKWKKARLHAARALKLRPGLSEARDVLERACKGHGGKSCVEKALSR